MKRWITKKQIAKAKQKRRELQLLRCIRKAESDLISINDPIERIRMINLIYQCRIALTSRSI